jgi:hypothetical protein
LNQEPKAISTQLVTCQLICMTHAIDDPSVQALLITYTDGNVEIRCPHKGPSDISKWAPGTYRQCAYEKK